MKIVEASVEILVGAYTATVVLLDEGRRYTGASRGEDPKAAMHAAFSNAANQIREERRGALSLELAITF